MHTDFAAQYRAYFSTYLNEIEPLTALCGARAIDSVMGAEWFAAFREQEIALDGKLATVKPSHDSIYKNDFQGIVKMFRFREEESDVRNIPSPKLITPVFEAFELPRKVHGRSVFSTLCDTLIANRNRVHHLDLNAAKTDNIYELKGNISFLKKSMLDCVSFLEYFKTILDDEGRPYIDTVYGIMEELESTYKNVRYNTATVIEQEGLDVTPERFNEICRELYITTFVIKGVCYFESNDYESDLRAIKAIIKSSAPSPQKKVPPFVWIFPVALAVVALLVFLLTKGCSADNGSSATTTSTTAQTTATTVSTGGTTATTQAGAVRITGTASYNGLEFTIDQKVSDQLAITVKNNDTCGYSFGWGTASEIAIEATEGIYFGNVTGRLAAGGTTQLVVNLQEDGGRDIKTVTVQSILTLGQNGLPDSSVGGVVTIPITYV